MLNMLYVHIVYALGVHVKMWNIHLKDDGLEENHEKFEVILNAPKNTVLGQRNKATVEIVDPRNGKIRPPSFPYHTVYIRIN